MASSQRNIELEMLILQKLQWIMHIGSIMKSVTLPVSKTATFGKPISVLERFLTQFWQQFTYIGPADTSISKESPWNYLRSNKGFKAFIALDPYCLEINGNLPCAANKNDYTRLEFRENFTDDFLKENNRFISPGPIELPSGSFMNVMAGMFAPHPTPPPPPPPSVQLLLEPQPAPIPLLAPLVLEHPPQPAITSIVTTVKKRGRRQGTTQALWAENLPSYKKMTHDERKSSIVKAALRLKVDGCFVSTLEKVKVERRLQKLLGTKCTTLAEISKYITKKQYNQTKSKRRKETRGELKSLKDQGMFDKLRASNKKLKGDLEKTKLELKEKTNKLESYLLGSNNPLQSLILFQPSTTFPKAEISKCTKKLCDLFGDHASEEVLNWLVTANQSETRSKFGGDLAYTKKGLYSALQFLCGFVETVSSKAPQLMASSSLTIGNDKMQLQNQTPDELKDMIVLVVKMLCLSNISVKSELQTFIFNQISISTYSFTHMLTVRTTSQNHLISTNILQ